jgi:membrane protein
MRSTLRSVVSVLAETGRRLDQNQVVEMSAALAFYSALSLAPLVVITLGVAGVLADRDVLQAHMVMQADAVLGHGTAELLSKLAAEQNENGSGTVATVGGLVALLLGATAVFGQLQSGLTRIFEGSVRSARGVWAFVRRRLISVAAVVGLGFLLIVSLVMNAVLSALAERLVVSERQASAAMLAQLAASMLVSMLMFSLLFRVMPDERVSWREAWAGGALSAVLFHLGEWAIGTYLGRASVGSTYGAAGTLVVLLVWVYYSSLIVFASAQLTHVVALRRRKARQARMDGKGHASRKSSPARRAERAAH